VEFDLGFSFTSSGRYNTSNSNLKSGILYRGRPVKVKFDRIAEEAGLI